MKCLYFRSVWICSMLLLPVLGVACSLLLASGKATNDGRPILCKIRDAGQNINMKLVKSEGYSFIGQFSVKEDGTESGPWGGFNEKGFGIVNSLSYNIQNTNSGALNDDVIKWALQSCTTIKDFERLLDAIQKPMAVRANYGVIDMDGNAVFYEVGQFGYTKYDSSDTNITSDGIQVRTNYSLSGDSHNKNGEDRYLAALSYVEKSKKIGKLDAEDVIRDFSRYLVKGDGTNLCENLPISFSSETKMSTEGLMSRKDNSCAFLIKGVRKDESPALTMMWAIAGYPLSTVAIPLVINKSCDVGWLPEKASARSGLPDLCEKGLRLKNIIFPYSLGDADCMDMSKVCNLEGSGIMQKIRKIEEGVFDEWQIIEAEAYKKGTWLMADIQEYYNWLDGYLDTQYDLQFPYIKPSKIYSFFLNDSWDSKIFNLWGQEVLNLSKGIVISKGRKMILK